MNAESFADYLAQPAKLYQLPYQEIKNLVAEYPFSSNLRYLLLLKSKIEQDPQFERYLHQYAAHSPDRPFLYQLLQEKMAKLLDLEVAQEERLELLDLGNFQEKEAILIQQQEEETPTIQTFQTETPIPSDSSTTTAINALEEDTNQEEDLVDMPESVPQAVTPTTTKLEKAVETAAPPPPSEVATTPLPKTAFDGWSIKITKPSQVGRFARLRGQNLRERTSGSAARVRQVAKESVVQQADLASETLAILLERQGQYEKAIDMYERLSLLNPEKSRYFAAAIEKLKQKV